MFDDIHLQIQETQKTPSWINTNKTTSWYFIVQLLKTKDKETILKADKRKVTLQIQGNKNLDYPDFLSETKKARMQWNNTLKILRGKKKSINPKFVSSEKPPSIFKVKRYFQIKLRESISKDLLAINL